MSKAKFLLPVAILLIAALACNYVAPTPQPTSTSLPPTVIPELTVIVEPSSAAPNNLPLSEAQVERVPPDVAWTAVQNGAAVIVDVRSVEAYAESHIKGAISIPLAEIENNPTGLKLEKEQWIITYCT